MSYYVRKTYIQVSNTPEWNKWIHQDLSDTHCEECLKLNECWFKKEQTPLWPHHLYCHCVLKNIPFIDVLTNSSSDCPYSKIDPYLFDPDNFYNHGKINYLRVGGTQLMMLHIYKHK